MPTHQDKGECPVTLHKQPVALYVPLETHTEGLGAWWYWQGQRLVKANFRPSRQQVAAHQSQRFSPAGLPQVLVACGRKGAFKKKKRVPTNIQWRERMTPHLPGTVQVWGDGSVLLPSRQTWCGQYLRHRTSRKIHISIKYTFTQRKWERQEPKLDQTFHRSKSKLKWMLSLVSYTHATVLYGNTTFRFVSRNASVRGSQQTQKAYGFNSVI